MSKLSFRARALDPSKQMPIFLAEELPDLPEYSAINRAVPQMPSGMEKEEESEHHLQRAICTGLIIPTPEVFTTDIDFYDQSYPANYKMPRQLIHMQPLGLEQDVPDYDMDSADEAWVNQQNRRLDLTPLKFEQMMDRLEKSSGQTVITLSEAKALLKQDDELSIAVYDYWLTKRLKMAHPLIPTVKTENRPGASSNNPYLAFRRRTEKMQTRKNRKNDETSYEKMLKLRRDLQRATTVLEMVKRREKTKREQLHLSIEIFEKRVQLRDYSGAVFSELNASLKNSRLAFAPLYPNQYSHHSSSAGSTPTGVPGTVAAGGTSGVIPPGLLTASSLNSNSSMPGSGGHLYSTASQYLNSTSLGIDVINTNSGAAGGVGGIRKEKRQYKKRKHKLPRDKQSQHHQYLPGVGLSTTASGASTASSVAHHSHLHHHLHRQSSSPAANESNIETEEEDMATLGSGHPAHKMGSESEDETPFAFRRKQNCDYLKASSMSAGNWPWEPKEEEGRTNGYSDPKYRFTLTSIRHPRPRCIGFARRRLGRGGRVIFDRVATNFDDFWSQLDYTILESGESKAKTENEVYELLKSRSRRIGRIPSPPTVVDLPHTLSNTPANSIKTEANEADRTSTCNAHNTSDDEDDDELSETDCDMYGELYTYNQHRVTHDRNYSSALSLKLKRLQRRIENQRKRLRERNELSNSGDNEALKRRKLLGCIDENVAIPTVVDATATKKPMDSKLPRHLLHRLAQAIEKHGGGSEVFLNAVDAIKEEPVSELNGDGLGDTEDALDSNRSSINNNNISSSNLNKNVSVSDKFNVIKSGTSSPSASSSSVMTTTKASTVANDFTRLEIKQEILDSTSCASADDSNEPLSSIQKSVAATATTSSTTSDIALEDEENVNLAQLSNIIRHTVKKEILDDGYFDNKEERQGEEKMSNSFGDNYEINEDDELPNLNQMADVIRARMRNKRNRRKQENNLSVIIEDKCDEYTGSLSPSSSQRLDVCNELLSEIRRDWLHFRPKTPTDELSDGGSGNDYDKLPALFGDSLTEPLVNWSKQTPIAVEILRTNEGNEGKYESTSTKQPQLSQTFKSDEPLFVSDPFKYEELDPDTQLLQSVYTPFVCRGSSKSPEGIAALTAGNSNTSGIDFNFSGDSLNDINLLEDGDETDENMLDNILQECQIDDIKTLNQATNFWNGILDGETPEVGDEVDDELLVCIGDKKTKDGAKTKHHRAKTGKHRAGNPNIGSCVFSVQTQRLTRDESFFSKEAAKQETVEVKTEVASAPVIESIVVKEEPTKMEVAANSTTNSSTPCPPLVTPINVRSPAATNPIGTSAILKKATVSTQLLQTLGGNVSELTTAQTQAQAQGQPQSQSQSQLLVTNSGHVTTQQQQQQQQVTEMSGNAVGDIINIPSSSNSGSASVTTLQSAQTNQLTAQQHHILQIKQQPVHKFRNITVHQLSQQNQQQQQQRQQQQQQQQLLLHMQRDLVTNTPVITQYVTSSTGTSGAGQLRQPTLTPIGSTVSGNHLAYITTTDDSGNGTQKIYIQKTNAVSASGTVGAGTQVPGNVATNAAVITLSNVKLDGDTSGGSNVTTGGSIMTGGNSAQQHVHTASTPTRILIESTGSGNSNSSQNVVGVSGSGVSITSSPAVNIISNSSEQQVAVHNITAAGNAVSGAGGTPLIVTTQRNAQQIGQQKFIQPTPQFVWHQIPTTTGGTVLTSRPGQKRQLNGPDAATDINKIFSRKYPQRKIITAHMNQHHQQLHFTKQQLVQVDEDSSSTGSSQSAASSGGGSNPNSVNEMNATTTTQVNVTQQQQQQPQLQKIYQKVIKMSSLPMRLSELNMQSQAQLQQQQQQLQQQQKQQQKHNSAATIAANHNYSLQPTAAIITSQSGGGQSVVGGTSNKIYLTSSGAATGVIPHGTANFTIATTSSTGELHSTTSGVQAQTQKLHYKDLQSGNLKVNIVSAASGTGNAVSSMHTVSAATTTTSEPSTVVLNKAQNVVTAATNVQQQRLKRERILNIIGATNIGDSSNTTVIPTSGTASENNKRVLYTSLLNVKKNNAGQVQMQFGPGGMAHALLRGRICNNQTIFTNMRTLPIATVQQTSATTGTTQVQVIASSSNNNTSVSNIPLVVTTAYATTGTAQQQLQQQQSTITTTSMSVSTSTPATTGTTLNTTRSILSDNVANVVNKTGNQLISETNMSSMNNNTTNNNNDTQNSAQMNVTTTTLVSNDNGEGNSINSSISSSNNNNSVPTAASSTINR